MVLCLVVLFVVLMVYLYGCGISYGDFYVYNIFWCEDGVCLLGDFGVVFFFLDDVVFVGVLWCLEVCVFVCLLEELFECSEVLLGQVLLCVVLVELQ